jgi:hypothetical protein
MGAHGSEEKVGEEIGERERGGDSELWPGVDEAKEISEAANGRVRSPKV